MCVGAISPSSTLCSQAKSPAYMKIKSLFDSREYDRIAYSVKPGDNQDDKEVLSLEVLASHLCLQKKVQSADGSSSLQTSKQKHVKPTVDYLDGEKRRLCKLADSAHERYGNDSVLTYLRAVVYQMFGLCPDPTFVEELLVRSIKLNQWNWAAWLELAQLNSPNSTELEGSISNFELYRFFKLEQYRAQKQFSELLSGLRSLKLKDWSYLDELEGLCWHELRDFPKAVLSFDRIIKRDPYYIGGMDVLSNCFFVLERSTELSQLATHWLAANPNAVETNVIVGNYYSLKSQHEKASLYFKRATLVAPSNANAWLLLGHELIELRNPSAALAAYQRAAQCPGSAKDLRPWYAMGQLFELINQFAFAVYYHNRAVQIDDSDARVWQALSTCYLKLNRLDESHECGLKAKRRSETEDTRMMF